MCRRSILFVKKRFWQKLQVKLLSSSWAESRCSWRAAKFSKGCLQRLQLICLFSFGICCPTMTWIASTILHCSDFSIWSNSLETFMAPSFISWISATLITFIDSPKCFSSWWDSNNDCVSNNSLHHWQTHTFILCTSFWCLTTISTPCRFWLHVVQWK